MLRGDACLYAGKEHPRTAEAGSKTLGTRRIEAGMLPDVAIFWRGHEFHEGCGSVARDAIGCSRTAIKDIEIDPSRQRSNDANAFNACDFARRIDANLGLTLRDKLHAPLKCGSMDDFLRHGVGDSKLLHHLAQVRTAWGL